MDLLHVERIGPSEPAGIVRSAAFSGDGKRVVTRRLPSGPRKLIAASWQEAIIGISDRDLVFVICAVILDCVLPPSLQVAGFLCSGVVRSESGLRLPVSRRPRASGFFYSALADARREPPCLGPSTTTVAPVFTRL
jgi:hypothetical protein